ncbi:unnamed protein product [Vitrella brassicaformis CCMP3155]|uniref:Uncharacterized protein n=1 Tax=Vitrella brassicaformis (strain CCMP3155) TaxID=1169540 RepID=A0A0G4GIP5_VITBC|nr:unnamed protein product [Vitrella brassicaformis CCMP3155]|eukprot:CEM29707.1 unnamed protein product [Vitrella brassicaformis CCMP3155]
MEEDKDNVGGGRVVLKMDLANAGVPEGMAMGEAYRVWTHAVLGCIGASVEPYSIITRVRMVKKVGSVRVEVWFAKADGRDRYSLRSDIMEAINTQVAGQPRVCIPVRATMKPHTRRPHA